LLLLSVGLSEASRARRKLITYWRSYTSTSGLLTPA
jgi:hypothetical protein